MNKLKIAVLFLLATPLHLTTLTPKGLLQAGSPAEYRETSYGIILVFTQQTNHEFEASNSMLRQECDGKKYWHIQCKHCQTHLVAGECGYTQVDPDDEPSTNEENKD